MSKLRMKQIQIAQWTGDNGKLSYSTMALGEDGFVYRYDPKCNGWLKMKMQLTKNCEIGNGHSR